MINIPGIGTSNLVVITWWWNRRDLWRSGNKRSEGSGRIVSPGRYLIPEINPGLDFVLNP